MKMFDRRVLFIFMVGLLLTPVEARSQLKRMATQTAAGAIKLDVEPEAPTAELNSAVPVRVFLRNANNQMATWNRPCTVNLEVTYPSKKTVHQQIVIPAGESSAVVKLNASEYGLTQIRVKESSDSLLSAGNTVFVYSARLQKQNKAVAKKKTSDITMLRNAPRLPDTSFLVPASWAPESLSAFQDSASAPTDTPEPPATPQLLLVNATGKEEILADGNDFARITVYYMAPDGGSAPSDIVLWMSWSNGKFSPQPMVIHRGELASEGKLVSSSPLEASITLVTTAPKVAVSGTSTLKVLFSPPIYGFGPATPEPIVKMSLIDREPVVGCFFNGEGHCIRPDKKQHVNVSSTNPTLHVNPDSADVSADDGTATFYLEPTWSGKANLDMWAPGYSKKSIAIEISLWLVLVLCLAGGLVGGIATRDSLKGSIWWRCFVGVLGAVVLVWLCVFTVIPQTHSMIAHSLVSVLVVGIVGGYGGTRVLDFAAKRLGVIS